MTKDTEKRVCPYCNKILSGNVHCYKAHLFLHNAIKPRYECNLCLRPYFRKDTYERHMHHHYESGHTNTQYKRGVKGYICDYCDRSFKDKRSLISHLKVHDDHFYTIARKYKCEACHVTYCEERLLKHHIRREHFNLQRKENILELKKLNETWIEPLNDSKACVEITKIKHNVIRIQKCNVKLESENVGTMQKCSVKAETKNVGTLQKYIDFKDMLHYSKVICDYCKKEMLKKSLLTHIKERHMKIRNFSCQICKRTFKRHYQLVDHDCGKRMRKRKNS